MGFNRDKVVGLLPWSLVEKIDEQHRDSLYVSAKGIASFVQSCFKVPKNPAEASAHQEIVELGYVPLKRGWPDFFVFGKDADVFMVEVKADGDSLSPEQRVIHHFLAEKGIDVYVRWGSEPPFRYHAVGRSTPWVVRFP